MTRLILKMLNAPILILLVAICVALQTSLFSSWPLVYIQPDAVLLIVVWCGLRRGLEEGGLITLIISEMAEIHSATPQGLYLISYMLVYLLVRASSRMFVILNLFSYAMLTLAASILWKLTGLVVLYMLGVNASQWKHTVTFLFFGAAIEGAFSIWTYPWLEKFDRITFKHIRAEESMDDELQISSEGL